MKKKIFSVVMASIFFLASFVYAAQDIQIQGNGFIEVEGMKYFEQRVPLDSLRRMAIMDAYRSMAESIGELHVTSESTMKNFSELNDEVRMAVEKIVQGARLVSTTRDSEGNFHATVRLNLFGGTNSIANIVIPKDQPIEAFPQPKISTISSNYTGLIVDCGGQLVSTAMLPKIKSVSGKEIYAFKYLDRNMVVGRGMVDYSDSINSGTQRAGNNPLIIQAIFVQDCDIVISDDDADKILAANSKSNFLKNCMVVFIK